MLGVGSGAGLCGEKHVLPVLRFHRLSNRLTQMKLVCTRSGQNDGKLAS